jgi:hypothetical protein
LHVSAPPRTKPSGPKSINLSPSVLSSNILDWLMPIREFSTGE